MPPSPPMPARRTGSPQPWRSEEHTSELQSLAYIVCRLLLEKKNTKINNGLIEYYGPKNPKTVLIALGSLVGTIKDAVDETGDTGVIKIKCLRPFPEKDILSVLKKAKYAAVIEKAVSLGASVGPIAMEIKAAAQGNIKTKIRSFAVGLGGRDITRSMIKGIIADAKKNGDKIKFVGKLK